MEVYTGGSIKEESIFVAIQSENSSEMDIHMAEMKSNSLHSSKSYLIDSYMIPLTIKAISTTKVALVAVDQDKFIYVITIDMASGVSQLRKASSAGTFAFSLSSVNKLLSSHIYLKNG